MEGDFDAVWEYIGWTCLLGVGGFVLTYTYKLLFGIIGENQTMDVRRELFRNILYKHIGWFDKPENSSGVLTSLLAEDV